MDGLEFFLSINYHDSTHILVLYLCTLENTTFVYFIYYDLWFTHFYNKSDVKVFVY